MRMVCIFKNFISNITIAHFVLNATQSANFDSGFATGSLESVIRYLINL